VYIRAIFIPNGVNCCKFSISRNISKNPNFKEKTKVEDLFTEIPNCFYRNAKTFSVFIDYYLEYCIEGGDLETTVSRKEEW